MILKNICLNRGMKKIFFNLNLRFANPGLNIIKGQNGSGKSSLLMLISGIITQDEGKILKFGYKDKSDWFQDHIFLKHTPSLSNELTVMENLEIWCGIRGWNITNSNLEKNLLAMGIYDYKDFLISECSAGIKRKVELSKLNIEKSLSLKYWLLDEPVNDLDKKGRIILKEIIDKFLKTKGTVIMTSHEEIINYKKFNLIEL